MGDEERAARPFRVLPDGGIDLLVRGEAQLGGRFAWELWLGGVLPGFKMVVVAPRETFWGVRFRPGWVEAVLGVPPLALPIAPIRAEELSAPLRFLARSLARCDEPRTLQEQLLLGVTRLVGEARTPPAPHWLEALRVLEARGGQVRVHELARSLGVGERTLHRQLGRVAGVSPKALARIYRFQNVAARLEGGGDLTRLALDGGYYDQAHLTRDFRELAGLSPGAWARQNRA